MDLDRFKDVNDSVGHPTGDKVLVEASHRLLEAVPEGGTLARLGGDEFAALLEDTPPRDAMAWAERVRQSLGRPYRVGNQEFLLSTSIGLLTTDPAEPVPTPSEALRDADLALHAAKAAGKDRVAAFQPDAPAFPAMVLATLRDTDLPGRALILEITESALMATSTADRAMAELDRLRTHQIRIAIDDFGTGYSSLAYVARLPVDIVK